MSDDPKFWLYEISGVLRPVIEAYLCGETLTQPQVGIMRAYLHQWITAPVWANAGHLVKSVETIGTQADIDAWLNSAYDQGIDPL